MSELQAKFQAEAAEFKALQKELQKAIAASQRLQSQCSENELVAREFSLLPDDAEVFKLVGPALMRQELAEASSNVQKRIEFIKAELKRADARVAELEKQLEDKKGLLMKLQAQGQALAAKAAQAL